MSCAQASLTIGPVRFILRSDASRPVRYDGWAYRGFFSCEANRPAATAEMDVEVVWEGLSAPATPPLYRSGSNWAVWPEGDGWLFATRFAGRSRPLYACRVSRDLRRARLFVDGDAGELRDAPLRYPLDQILSWPLLARCQGVITHSALVERNGLGYLFCGRSGAGKSTLSALCRDAGWRALNDDRAAVFLRAGRPFAAGTPWHGSGRFAEAGEVPLAGLFCLQQAPAERIVRLEPAEARFEVIDSVSIPWFEENWAQSSLDALDALLQAVPVYRFSFTKTAAAVAALERCRETAA